MAKAVRAFVCGHPVAHSRSPLIHRHWLAKYRIGGAYERFDVKPEDIGDFIESLAGRGLAGGNFTIPHKEAAFAAVARCDEAAEMIGAVNTVWLEDGRLIGINTDAPGFAANLDDAMPEWRRGRMAAVVGAGGAARAVLFALLQAGYDDVRVVNRSVARARELADRFGRHVSAHNQDGARELLGDVDLLVNTTSLGMDGNADLPADVTLLPDKAIVTDIVYVPLITPLLAAAASRGLKTVDGLGMLLHQAVPGFEKWFGVTPEVTGELRARVITDMERH